MLIRYQHKIELKEAEEKTLQEYLDDGGSNDKKELERYIETWNHVSATAICFTLDEL